jgi:hypothetical protein
MKTADYIKTFALAAIVLFFTLQKGYGWLWAMIVCVFLFVALYNLFRLIRKPDERKKRSIRLAIWSVTLTLAGSVQIHWSIESHNTADKVIKTILAYKSRLGTYPKTLKEIGINAQDLDEKWELRYILEEGKPRLVYPMPFMVLGMYEYDFETGTLKENTY